MARQREIVVALGAPGAGKTTLAHRFMERYPESAGGVAGILDPGGAFEGGEWPGSDPKALEEWLGEVTGGGQGPQGGGRRGLLILDDADRYLFHTSYGAWRDVWLANRHLQLDVFVTGHRATALPKDLLGSASELWLFKMQEPRALDYLARIPALEHVFSENRHPLPTVNGTALRVRVHEGTVAQVKLFDPQH